MDIQQISSAIQQWNKGRTDVALSVNRLRTCQFIIIDRSQYTSLWQALSDETHLHIYIGAQENAPVFFAIDSISDSLPLDLEKSSKIVNLPFRTEITNTLSSGRLSSLFKEWSEMKRENNDGITSEEAWNRGFRWLMFSSSWMEEEIDKQTSPTSLSTGVARVMKIPMKDVHRLFGYPTDEIGLFFGLRLHEEYGVILELILTVIIDNYPHHEFSPLEDVTTPFPPFHATSDFGLLNYSDQQ